MSEKQALLGASSPQHHSAAAAALAFVPLALAGEAIWALSSSLARLQDGSMIVCQLDKPSYTSGEVCTGKIVAMICSPLACESVALKVKLKLKSEWDEEHSFTQMEKNSEGQDVPVTHWRHDTKHGKKTLFKELVVVSQIAHLLPPGTYCYPFSFPIPAGLPGVAKFKKVHDSSDPHWRKAHKQLETKASVTFSVKAVLQSGGGFFHKELKSVQEIPVNPAFDWAKMQPATASEARDVKVCCCFNKGPCSVTAVCNKGAFQSGETMLVTATFRNDSTAEIRSVQSRLYRQVIVGDGKGHTKRYHDVVCQARFPGVPPQSTVIREMPLVLKSAHGPLQPSITTDFLTIRYTFDCVADIAMASDIEAQLPVTIYEPSPAVYGVATMMAPGTIPASVASMLAGPPPGAPSAPPST